MTTLQGGSATTVDTVRATLGSQQRLNLLWNATDRIRVVAEGRGRLYLGEDARPATPLANLLGRDAGMADLSVNPVVAEGAVWNTQVDRAFVDYRSAAWDLRVGRQRIHWGSDLYWNPADFFNARDALDFDYEESPGTDAARVRHYTRGHIWTGSEAAVSTDRDGNLVAAGRLIFHASEYDLQLIGASHHGELAVAGGFAGNLGRAGWKGEVAVFTGIGSEASPVVNASTTVDHVLSTTGREGLYLGASVFVGGTTGYGLSATDLTRPPPGARNPFPSRYALQGVASRPITPALSWQAAVLWMPDEEAVLLSPSLQYAAAQQLDLQLLARLHLDHEGGLNRESGGLWLRTRYAF